LDGGSNSRKALKKKMEMWPTPATKGYGHAAEGMVGNLMEKIERGVITKLEAEQMLSLPKLENHRTWKKNWPTPRASDFKGATSAEAMSKAAARGFNPNLPEATAASVGGGKLNPTWVEWLMGWPLGWTDSKPLEMDKSHCVQQPLGES
jgi:DNA (cytosine-5)-methyltransferase 1